MKKPVIHPSAFVADNATVRGSVTLGANSSVFFGAVLRGDRAPITIGAGTNIQDNCVVHVDYDHPVTVGENVTVGHGRRRRRSFWMRTARSAPTPPSAARSIPKSPPSWLWRRF